jgi:hypothetical protein
MSVESVLLGDRRQGNKINVAGNQTGLQGCHQHALAPHGVYLTWLVEPCGALPRKCYYYYNNNDNKHLRG